MLRRCGHGIRTYLICAIVLLPLLLAGCGKPEPQHYNILMIVVDDMNDWVGVMRGKAETPHIDALAADGVLFTNAYCVVPACNPSRVAMMSGLRPETTGQYNNAGNFRDKLGGGDIITLPQYLRQYGYEAVASGKVFHHPRGVGKDPNPMSDPISWDAQRKGIIGTPGILQYRDAEGRARWMQGAWRQYPREPNSEIGMDYLSRTGVWGGVKVPNDHCGDWLSALYCADYLRRDHDTPFFLACGIFRPHAPQLSPQPYVDRYPLESVVLPEVPSNDMDDIPQIAKRNGSTPFVELVKKKGQWKKAVQGYLASMTFADDCVGLVLAALDSSRYRDNTIVVFWSDHGWQLGHKNRWEKFTLWHQATNAPFIIRYPGMNTAGRVCEQAVSFLDIYPTLLELTGIPPRGVLEGETLVPWLEKPSKEKETPAIVTYPQGSYSVVWKYWNYIHYVDGSEELYNHRTDPREFTNLANREKYRELMNRLKRMIPGQK
jgi:arylsulfatase A-like enzyme